MTDKINRQILSLYLTRIAQASRKAVIDMELDNWVSLIAHLDIIEENAQKAFAEIAAARDAA